MKERIQAELTCCFEKPGTCMISTWRLIRRVSDCIFACHARPPSWRKHLTEVFWQSLFMQGADCSKTASGTGHCLYSNTVTRGFCSVFPRAELHQINGAITVFLSSALSSYTASCLLPWHLRRYLVCDYAAASPTHSFCSLLSKCSACPVFLGEHRHSKRCCKT